MPKMEAPGADTILGLLKSAIRNTVGRLQRQRLIGQAVRELLTIDPDIDRASAKLKAARAIGLAESEIEVRANRIEQRVRGSTRAFKKVARHSSKKATKKKKNPTKRSDGVRGGGSKTQKSRKRK